MLRRTFLGGAVALAGARFGPARQEWTSNASTRSVTPVVGDGRWIWQQPPRDERGYLEARPFRLSMGIEWEGTGSASQIRATTPVPASFPEQRIDRARIETRGASAELRSIAEGARQLVAFVPSLTKGQLASATAHFELTLFKQYHAFERDQFPAEQRPPAAIAQTYLRDSPGIETGSREVRTLVAKLHETKQHPWDEAAKFCQWVRENIRPQLGRYTSVVQALQTQQGDCEEMAGVMIALCRAIGIPARLVWVPNHAWAEFYLVDHEGRGRWIPAHTAAYPWFGFTGAHELVLQKGDRLRVPEKAKLYRLLEDWNQWSGARPEVRYRAELTPVAEQDGADPGPGARSKSPQGEWLVVGEHPLDRYVRR